MCFHNDRYRRIQSRVQMQIFIRFDLFLNPDIENAHIRRTLHVNRTSPKTGKIVSYPRSRSRKKGGLKDNLIPDKNDSDSKECSNQEYEIMKVRRCIWRNIPLQLPPVVECRATLFVLSFQDNLLLYNHARLMSQDNHSKEYLVSIMFSHYDRNNNGNLEREELEQVTLLRFSFAATRRLFDCLVYIYIYIYIYIYFT